MVLSAECGRVNGRFLRFLQALYEGSICRVIVNGQISDDFEVNTGYGRDASYPHCSSPYTSMGL